MVIRGAPAIGVAAAMGIALGMKRSKAQGTKQFAVEFNKICDLMAGTRPTAVNLFWAIDRMKRSFGAGVQAGQSVDELKARLEAEAHAIHDEDVASCQAMGRFGAEVVPDERAHPDALQRRRAGHGGLRHRARRDSRRRRARQGRPGVRRRDAAVPAGRAPDGLGTGARPRADDGHHREHGRAADAPGRHRLRRRRRRPHRRQRRLRQQDRHLHGRDDGARARRAVLRRRAAVDDRSGHRRRQRHSDRAAQRARGDALRRHARGARGRQRLESGVRRDARRGWSTASSPRRASPAPTTGTA